MTRHLHAALLVVLVGAVLAPILMHPGYLVYPRTVEATDLTITHWPAVAFNVRTLYQDGQVPLWRTTIASGGPWAANPQSWLFYPPAWLFFAPGMPISATFNVLLLAHLLLAALATYALGRRALALTPAGSCLAGLVFALAPWVCAQLAAGHINIILALAWLPVALLGAHRLATTGRLGSAVLAGVAWAAAILNHMQTAAFIVALTLAWSIFLLWHLRAENGARALPDRRGLQPARVAGLLLMVPAVGLLLSAALLVPLAEALPYLNRGALTLEEAGIFSLTWPHLLTALIPTYGGEPEQAIYAGLPVLLLAVLAPVLKRDRVTWFWVSAGGVAILYALGTHGPLYPLLFRLVPGLSWLRVPPRAWGVVALAVAVLAGRGLDALTSPSLSAAVRRRATTVTLVTLVAGLVLAAGLAFLYRPVPSAVWTLGLLTVLSVTAVLLRVRLLITPRNLSVAFLLLAALDLGLFQSAWIEMRDPADAFAWGAEVAEALAEQQGQFRVYSPSYSLPQHTAFEHGLYLADGVDPFQLAHYADYMAVAGGYGPSAYSPTLPPRLDDTTARPDAYRLGLLNVGNVASSFPIEIEGLVLREQVGDTYLYDNEQMLPRVFVVAQPEAAGQISLEHNMKAVPAQMAVYTPNRIVVESELAEPGLLVLSEVWYPGWRALDNGVEVPIRRIEGVLRGVDLQAGAHKVEFRYASWTVWLGLAVSGGTALTLAIYGASHLWRRT